MHSQCPRRRKERKDDKYLSKQQLKTSQMWQKTNLMIQEDEQTPNRILAKKPMPRHNIIKLHSKDKMILKQ